MSLEITAVEACANGQIHKVLTLDSDDMQKAQNLVALMQKDIMELVLSRYYIDDYSVPALTSIAWSGSEGLAVAQGVFAVIDRAHRKNVIAVNITSSSVFDYDVDKKEA